jgi:hypothetical protein
MSTTEALGMLPAGVAMWNDPEAHTIATIPVLPRRVSPVARQFPTPLGSWRRKAKASFRVSLDLRLYIAGAGTHTCVDRLIAGCNAK